MTTSMTREEFRTWFPEAQSQFLKAWQNQLDAAQEITHEVLHERCFQMAKWDEQNESPSTFYVILGEEFGEAGKAILEKNWKNYREELIQVAAVAMRMVQALDCSHICHYCNEWTSGYESGSDNDGNWICLKCDYRANSVSETAPDELPF